MASPTAGQQGRYSFSAKMRPTLRLNCDSRVLPLPLLFQPHTIMADLLSSQDIKAWLKKLPQWDHEKKHIERLFEFDDFDQAIEFVK